MSENQNPLIIALDVDNEDEAFRMVDKIGDRANFYKVGMELYAAAGMDVVSRLRQLGKQVFLDLKLYDIGETVKRATRQICAKGSPTFLTVHGSRAIMNAAMEGLGDSPTKLLAVTVLTSFNQDDLKDLGYNLPLSDLVDLLVRKAKESGVHGLVCSAVEVARVRASAGPEMILVTPGVRSAGAHTGDQKRVATPVEAIQQGADYLVIGRQVTRAADPALACQRILDELAEGCRKAPQPVS